MITQFSQLPNPVGLGQLKTDSLPYFEASLRISLEEDMHVNKAQLVEAVAAATDLPKSMAAKTLDAVLDSITSSLVAGDVVSLVGFGTFAVKSRAARTGRNPKTGEPIQINASIVASFKAGKGLKEAVNSDETDN